MNIPLILLKSIEKSEIEQLFAKVGDFNINLTKCKLENWFFKEYKRLFSKTIFGIRLKQFAKTFLNDINTGYIVIDIGRNNYSEEKLKKILLFILSGILLPFGIFDQFGLFREIGVNLNKSPNRSTGIGYNPFHIDFVNTTIPPNYSILYCIREDKNGGGETIISNIQRSIKTLSPTEHKALFNKCYHEGSFFGLNNVGTELNPFPIIGSGLNPIIRFTSKIESDDTHNLIVKKIEQDLIKEQIAFLLRANQLLILNQRIVCHGRKALKGKQEEIPQEKRRLLFQIFGEKYEI